MKQRPFVLVVHSQAVQSSWEKVVSEMRQMKPWEHQQDAADFARARKSTMNMIGHGNRQNLNGFTCHRLALIKTAFGLSLFITERTRRE